MNGRTCSKKDSIEIRAIFLREIIIYIFVPEKLWQKFRKLAEDYYIFRIWFVVGALVVTRHPDDIKVFI